MDVDRHVQFKCLLIEGKQQRVVGPKLQFETLDVEPAQSERANGMVEFCHRRSTLVRIDTGKPEIAWTLGLAEIGDGFIGDLEAEGGLDVAGLEHHMPGANLFVEGKIGVEIGRRAGLCRACLAGGIDAPVVL